jgi:hypothetical protein
MFGEVRACISNLDELEAEVRLRIPSPNIVQKRTPVPLSTTRGTLVSMVLCQCAEEAA